MVFSAAILSAPWGAADWWIAECVQVSSMKAVEEKLHTCFGPFVPSPTGGREKEVFEVPYPKAVNFLRHIAKNFEPKYPLRD